MQGGKILNFNEGLKMMHVQIEMNRLATFEGMRQGNLKKLLQPQVLRILCEILGVLSQVVVV